MVFIWYDSSSWAGERKPWSECGFFRVSVQSGPLTVGRTYFRLVAPKVLATRLGAPGDLDVDVQYTFLSCVLRFSMFLFFRFVSFLFFSYAIRSIKGVVGSVPYAFGL